VDKNIIFVVVSRDVAARSQRHTMTMLYYNICKREAAPHDEEKQRKE
jgi:hypothetical protein